MATITKQDMQDWLEGYADTWMRNPQITPVLIAGVTEVGVRFPCPHRSLRDGLYERVPPPSLLTFYAVFLGGLEFITTRYLPPPLA